MDQPATRPDSNPQAERALLGAMLLGKTENIETAIHILSPYPTPFHDTRHQQLWQTIQTLHQQGHTPDLVITADHLRTQQRWTPTDDIWLTEIYHEAPTTPQTGYYARIVAEHAQNRNLLEHLTRLAHTARSDLPPERRRELLEQQGHTLLDHIDIATGRATSGDGTATATLHGRTPIELTEFLQTEDPPYNWLIPGLLERGDRVIVTGGEGSGKSTLLRQIGYQTAAGIHPFTNQPITPLKVLIVDLENSETQIRRALRPLHIQGQDTYTPTPGLHIEPIPEGIDLLQPDTGRQLLALAEHHQPDLIITGPIYKMHAGDPTEEQPARVVSSWLDRLRVTTGCALLIETHSPHQPPGRNQQRPTRPYGASLWMRWPEFGIHIGDDGRVTHWRGQRDQRAWPRHLVRGGRWPWTAGPDQIAEITARTNNPEIVLPNPNPASGLRPAIHRLVRALDQHRIPLTYGRDRAGRELTREGITWRTADLGEAIQWRRDQQDATSNTPEPPGLELFDETYDGRQP